MEAVVERGTGTVRADRRATPIAGKTGTAQKLVNGRYSNTDYNVSFVGFVPSRKPVFTIVVVVDSPQQGATVWRRGRRADLQADRRQPRCVSTACRRRSIPRRRCSSRAATPRGTHEQPTSTAGITPNIVTVDGGAHAAHGFVPGSARAERARRAAHAVPSRHDARASTATGIVVRAAARRPARRSSRDDARQRSGSSGNSAATP